jgi:hypothetical protein
MFRSLQNCPYAFHAFLQTGKSYTLRRLIPAILCTYGLPKTAPAKLHDNYDRTDSPNYCIWQLTCDTSMWVCVLSPTAEVEMCLLCSVPDKEQDCEAAASHYSVYCSPHTSVLCGMSMAALPH